MSDPPVTQPEPVQTTSNGRVPEGAENTPEEFSFTTTDLQLIYVSLRQTRWNRDEWAMVQPLGEKIARLLNQPW